MSPLAPRTTLYLAKTTYQADQLLDKFFEEGVGTNGVEGRACEKSIVHTTL